MQRQAEPFFLQDLVFLSAEIAKRVNVHVHSSAQLFVLARDQAFFKIQFFAGDRAGDLGRMKTKEILYFRAKRLYSLTIHSLSLCETALQTFLLSSVMRTLLFAR